MDAGPGADRANTAKQDVCVTSGKVYVSVPGECIRSCFMFYNCYGGRPGKKGSVHHQPDVVIKQNMLLEE